MSELINKTNRGFRWNLLTTVSTTALLGFFCGLIGAQADDTADKPTVWIELGGQLNRMNNGEEAFAPPVLNSRPSKFDPSQPAERLPRYGFDETGKILIEPENSSWHFSASARYGRSSSNKHVRQQSSAPPFVKYQPNYNNNKITVFPRAAQFADTNARTSENHLVLDFQAGKDVGLGLFGGKDGSSIISLGVRFAQFNSRSNISVKSNPDWHFNYKYLSLPSVGYNHFRITHGQPYHSNAAALIASHSFRGIGPSLSWAASAPFAGNPQQGELDLDWGVNIAALFGRQKARTEHHATGRYNTGGVGALGNNFGVLTTIYHDAPSASVRSHSATVPNVGGFAGVSVRYDAAKVSFGYRADFFFGAVDGGIDARKTYDRSFYGPFATISIGLGG